MRPSWSIGPVRPDHHWEALRLVFQHHAGADQDQRVDRACQALTQGQLTSQGLIEARQGDTLLGAMICQPLAGAGAQVCPPQVQPHEDAQAIEDALIRFGRTWLRGLGVKLAQALLEPELVESGASLLRHDFKRITSLCYLGHDLANESALPPSEAVVFQTYASADQDLFHRTLLQSYEETDDCPEITGVRTIAEIMEGHRATGIYDPSRWWLVWQDSAPVAVVILTDMGPSEGWDISYLGVIPEARRRGVGRQLVVKALTEARRAGAAQLTLAVDARNLAAQRLYQRLGFHLCERKAVFLAIWPGSEPRR